MSEIVKKDSESARIIEEEETLHHQVQERVRHGAKRKADVLMTSDLDRDLIELRDAIGEAKPEDLAPLVEQMTRLAALRGQNEPVFVYFTADWCLTCKVNERAVLDQDEVAEAFRARGVRVLVGDWTRGDEAIGRFLARHGRSGVPLYLYYAPGREAEILPQILTVGRVTSLGS